MGSKYRPQITILKLTKSEWNARETFVINKTFKQLQHKGCNFSHNTMKLWNKNDTFNIWMIFDHSDK